MKLYEEEILNKDVKHIFTALLLLIKFFRSKHSLSLKLTIGVLVSLGLGSILTGIWRSISQKENCDKIKDPLRKSLCKKTLELKYVHGMIHSIDVGISKLNLRNIDDREKVEHLKKDRKKLIDLRDKLEKEYHTILDKMSRNKD